MRNGFRFVRWGVQTAILAALALFQVCAYSASKTVLVLGDSLSAEYGLTRGSGWVPLLQNRLKNEKIDAVVMNASISGETTSGGKTRLLPLLEKHRPAVVMIELGANDALRGLSLAATAANLQEMISTSKKNKARVLLLGMQIPPNYGSDYTKNFAALYPRLAKETKSSLVPFLLEGIAAQPQLFQADRIHPVADAQPIIVNTVWPHLKPLLSE